MLEAGIAKRQAASVYLKALVEEGQLQEVRAGRLLALLSDRGPLHRKPIGAELTAVNFLEVKEPLTFC
uniref:hypothetical protein n=1 Tax=Mesorhizobium sp. WSM4875 TaxID=3038539 RepID=UPI0032EA5CCC